MLNWWAFRRYEMGSSLPHRNLAVSTNPFFPSWHRSIERCRCHRLPAAFQGTGTDLHISYIFLVRSSNPGWPRECNTTNFVPMSQSFLRLVRLVAIAPSSDSRGQAKKVERKKREEIPGEEYSPVAVKNTFPPKFSASKASSPPPPDPGVRRFVIAWIPCNVPARIKTVLRGNGGSMSTGSAWSL